MLCNWFKPKERSKIIHGIFLKEISKILVKRSSRELLVLLLMHIYFLAEFVMCFRAFAAGNYTISLQDSEGVFSNGQKIYLKDKQTGVVTDLTAGSYTFASEKGEFTGRFEIVYEPQAILGTGNAVKAGLQLYRDGEDFVVRASDQTIDHIEVYDVGGRLHFTLRANSREARFAAARLTDGVYVVMSVMKDGSQITHKIRK